MNRLLVASLALVLTSVLVSAQSALRPPAVASVDHYVRVKSSVPVVQGQTLQLYVRERARPETIFRGADLSNRVVLMIHGAGTPAEVTFDPPHTDYSWMAYLAEAGFDVFAMDVTGYGRSSRTFVMDDPCNLATEVRTSLFPKSPPCTATYSKPLTSAESDWADIAAVVDYIRALRGVERVSIVGWSLGGPRSGGYAAKNPEKVNRMVLLAPAYAITPTGVAGTTAFNTQTAAQFTANWDRQVGCPGQYDPAVRDAVWSAMLESDPVGATWGPGVRRAPNTQVTGSDWNTATAARTMTPTLLVSGIHDKQVDPSRVRQLYADLGASDKVFIDLGCSSHMALWEKNHLLLFDASRQWLTTGTVNGMKQGTLRLGYEGTTQTATK